MDFKDTLVLPYTSFEMRGNLSKKEPLILEKWSLMDVYQRANDLKKRKTYILHDGPPYANGKLHTGHMLNRFLKDFIVRFKNMDGYRTPIRYGWDTHGLPIENVLAKKGIKWREIGVTAFRLMCEEYALQQVEIQKETAIRLGTMSDIDHPYITLDRDYEASQVEVFAKLALDGLIFKGLKPVYWSPSSETALAEAEIEYKDIESYELYVSFSLLEGNEYVNPGDKLIIWTTTPWTLPSNLGLCLNPEFVYSLLNTNIGRIVVLKERIPDLSGILGLTEYETVKEFKGSALEKLKAQHPFIDRTSLVMNARFVTSEAGTGIVHIAPGHGADDYSVSLNYGIKPYCPVDSKGVFDETVGPRLSGLYYEKGNEVVIDMLKENNALLYLNRFTHSYPHDWRTKKPLIYRATPQWFCSIEPIRDELIKQVNKIKWHNSWSKTRMYNMIKDRGDWCISRQRVWGVPIPMILCEDGTPVIEKEVFDIIINEIREHGSNIWFDKDPTYFLPEGYTNEHSPNGIYTKEKDIMDVWFDSGSSFNGVLLKDGQYPADLYLEGSDQYRGWFNSSLILSTAYTGFSSYKACASHGFIQDLEGEKMSKSKGNVLDPEDLMKTYGADILRLWSALSDYTQDVRIGLDQLDKTSEVYKKIRNTFRFMLANLSNHLLNHNTKPFNIRKNKVTEFEFIDKVVLARFEEVKNNYIRKFRELDFINALNPLIAFLSNEMSSFYLDISKDVLYCDDLNSLRRLQIQNVIYYVLVNSMKLLNPILVFTMDEVNSSLSKPLAENVQFLRMPMIRKSKFKDLTEIGAKFFDFRDQVLKVIESLRQEKLIGKAIDADVVAYVDDAELRKVLSAMDVLELRRLFGVSDFKLSDQPLPNNIIVRVSGAEKCDRCWNHETEIITVGENKLCKRCYEVLKARGEI